MWITMKDLKDAYCQDKVMARITSTEGTPLNGHFLFHPIGQLEAHLVVVVGSNIGFLAKASLDIESEKEESFDEVSMVYPSPLPHYLIYKALVMLRVCACQDQGQNCRLH